MEEWLKIPLDEVRKLHDSIPAAVQKAVGGQTPYQIDFLWIYEVFQLFRPTPVPERYIRNKKVVPLLSVNIGGGVNNKNTYVR